MESPQLRTPASYRTPRLSLTASKKTRQIESTELLKQRGSCQVDGINYNNKDLVVEDISGFHLPTNSSRGKLNTSPPYM
jgi:hypothetical protein